MWSNIYRKYENNIEEMWNVRKREEYENMIKDIEEKRSVRLNAVDEQGTQMQYIQTCAVEVWEHIDMARRVTGGEVQLQQNIITEERVARCLGKMKSKRAVGTDNIKGQMYKEIGNSTVLKEILAKGMKSTLESGHVPPSWKESRTVMIPKTRCPKAKDLRPIALTNVGYKLMMSIIRDSLEDHITKNSLGKQTQGGFTERSTIENNIFVLKYCIQKSFKMKKR